jgi:hypothetical protein
MVPIGTAKSRALSKQKPNSSFPAAYKAVPYPKPLRFALKAPVLVEQMEMKQPNDCRKWIEALSKGTLIHVVGDKAEPSKVKIVAGQTVFWAVEKAPGISITDSRFVGRVGR